MKRLMIILGTRPEAVKLAPVIRELKKHPEQFEVRICVTAQHRELLDQALSFFSLQPDIDLNIMKEGQSLSTITTRVLSCLEDLFRKERPDLIMVQGDTTTVLTASLAAFYHQIPVAHVEAGLRTGDPRHPFPEEINRRLTSVLADLHFAPTEGARKNLLQEGVPEARIFVTGNTVIDALLEIAAQPYSFHVPSLDDEEEEVILITAHRRENQGKPLRQIFRAIQKLAQRFPDRTFVLPVHPNPEVRIIAQEMLTALPNVLILKALGYNRFVHLMKRSTLILTDSGGIQEEAPSLNKPVLILRNVTERPEVVMAGAAKLVGTNEDKIVEETTRLLTDKTHYRKMTGITNPFGDGKASRRIVEVLLRQQEKPGAVEIQDLKEVVKSA